MEIRPLELFNTPDSWRALEDWIMAHPPEDQLHLWTAAGMAWNLAAAITKETEDA
jgi:hypothetical protein